MEKDKMHRVVKIGTGKVTYVSGSLAKDPDLLLDYGFILQELPEETRENIPSLQKISIQLENELKEKLDESLNSHKESENINEREVAKKLIESNTNSAIEKALTVEESKPKRTYNKQTK